MTEGRKGGPVGEQPAQRPWGGDVFRLLEEQGGNQCMEGTGVRQQDQEMWAGR